MNKLSKITLIFSDHERELNRESIGYCTITPDLNSQELQEINQYITSNKGVKMTALFNCKLKLVLSEVFFTHYIFLMFLFIGKSFYQRLERK